MSMADCTIHISARSVRDTGQGITVCVYTWQVHTSLKKTTSPCIVRSVNSKGFRETCLLVIISSNVTC